MITNILDSLASSMNFSESIENSLTNEKSWKSFDIQSYGIKGMLDGAYCHAFVYSNRGNFLLKGHMREVKDVLKGLAYRGWKWFANFAMFGPEGNRNSWYFYKDSITIGSPLYVKKGYRWNRKEYVFWRNHKVVLKMTKLPKKWIKLFNSL